MSGAAAPDTAAPAAAPAAPPETPAQGAQGGQQPTQSAAGAQANADAAAAQKALDNAQQKAGETDQEWQTRQAKLTREARLARQDAERFRGEATEATARAAALQSELDKLKARKGISRRQYVELSHKIGQVAGDEAKLAELFDPEDELQDFSPAARERIEKLERDAAEAAEAKRVELVQGAIRKEIEHVQGVMTQLAESGDCPLFADFPGYAHDIRRVWWRDWEAAGKTEQGRPDLVAIAQRVHKSIAGDILTALQSERSRSFLLTASPELKALFKGAPGETVDSPPSENQGAGRGNAPPAQSPPLTERKAATEPAPSDKPAKKLTRLQLEEQRKREVFERAQAFAREVKGGG